MPRRFLSVVIVVFSFVLAPSVSAQELDVNSLGVSNSYNVQGTDVDDGDIVSSASNGYYLSITPYDPGMIGVVTKKPAISITDDGDANAVPVASNGIVYVNVSGAGGPIKKGDYVTSSNIPGVGMKAVDSGFILGTAQEDFNGTTADSSGKIRISIDLRFAVSPKASKLVLKNVKDVLTLSTVTAVEKPSDVFRYLIAGLTVLISIVFSMFTVGRNAGLGIEALGRNPRASKRIVLGISINILAVLGIIGAGLAAAYFMLAI